MKAESPLVSVLMTAYNREKYIAAAIQTLLVSTYKDFELIIVDDCSTDTTVEIAKSFAVKDDRIKIFVNEKNLGQFKNRNYSTSLAKGKYLKFLDSDDMIYPNGLEVLVRMMEQFPDAGYGLCSLIQDDRKMYPFMLLPKESYEYNYKYTSIFHKAPLSSIIKRSAFEAINGFDVEAVCGDYAFWLKIASYYPVVLMPDGIVWYRGHAEGEMQKAKDSSKIAFEYLKVEEMYLSDNKIISQELKKELLRKNKNRQTRFCLSLVKHLKIKELPGIMQLYSMDPKKYFKST